MAIDKEKAAVFIDASNIHYPLKQRDWRISYQRLASYFNKNYNVVKIYYYEGTPSKSYLHKRFNICKGKEIKERIRAKEEFFKSLKKLGFIVRTKPVQIVFDVTNGTYKAKCNFDVEVTIDAIDSMNDYNVFVLLSGDGDFIKLLKYLKGHYKKTVVISAKGHSSDKLRTVANKALYIQEIKGEIEKRS